jgi:predicted transcriptional regulator of viral defense system
MKELDSHLPQGRLQLAHVLSASGNVINIDDVVKSLKQSRTEAAKRLSRWTEQGWLKRVGRGAYVPVALDTLGADRVLDDPWVLVPALYAPCYVGGRTAAEHWDLTEQIFKDVVVITEQWIRKKHQIRHGTPFTLKHMTHDKFFGTKSVWRHQSKVLVSDVHRTIIDMLDDPPLGGGIQHVSECVGTYLGRADHDNTKIVHYAKRLGNGAVLKRLGFLADRHPHGADLAKLCADGLTKGNAKLDPALDCPRLIAKWRLLIPTTWKLGAGA